MQELGAQLVQLDGVLAHYGPEANEARAQLRRMVAAQVARLWPDAGATRTAMQAQQKYTPTEDLFDTVTHLAPKSEAQRSAQNRALQLMTTMGTTIRLLFEQAGGSLSWPFLVVLVFWLVALFVGFGLFARGNATVVAALFVGALTVAGAIFLILEMTRPYSGLMQMSSAPLQERADTDGTLTGLVRRPRLPAGTARTSQHHCIRATIHDHLHDLVTSAPIHGSSDGADERHPHRAAHQGVPGRHPGGRRASTSRCAAARSSGCSGPNGAGKTTTAGMLTTRVIPTSGRRVRRRRRRRRAPDRGQAGDRRRAADQHPRPLADRLGEPLLPRPLLRDDARDARRPRPTGCSSSSASPTGPRRRCWRSRAAWRSG